MKMDSLAGSFRGAWFAIALVAAGLALTGSAMAAGSASAGDPDPAGTAETCVDGVYPGPLATLFCDRPALSPSGHLSDIEGFGLQASSDDPAIGPGCAVPTVDDKCEDWDGEGIFLASDPVDPRVYAVGDQLRAFEVATGTVLWESEETFQTPWSIAASPDGSTVFVADLLNQLDGDAEVLAFDASSGELLWSTGRFEVRADGYAPPDLAVSPDAETVFVSSTSRPNPRTGNNFQLHALDAETGDEVWTTLYNGPKDLDDFARTVEVTPDGSQVIVAGDSLSGEYSQFVDQHPWEPALVSFDADTGDQRWEARYSGPGEAAQLPADDVMAISADGERVYIAGKERMAHDDKILDYFTVAYDADTGEQEWVTSYRGSPVGPYESVDWLTSITASPAGDDRVFVTGASGPFYPTAAAWTTIAYDGGTGEQLWAVASDVPGEPSDVAVGPSGDQVYVFGVSSPAFYAPNRFSTVAYDAATGEQTWAARMATTPGDTPVGASTVPAALEVAGDGSRVFVGGTEWAPGTGSDQMIVAYETGAPELVPGARG